MVFTHMSQKSFQTPVCHDLNFCLRTCHSVQHSLEFNDSTDLTNRTHVWKRLFCPCLMPFLLSRSLFPVSNHLVCRSSPPGTPVGKPPLPPNPNGSSHLWSRAARSGAPRGAKSELRGRRGLGQRAPRGQGRALWAGAARRAQEASTGGEGVAATAHPELSPVGPHRTSTHTAAARA
jgi:hypothetical protein